MVDLLLGVRLVWGQSEQMATRAFKLFISPWILFSRHRDDTEWSLLIPYLSSLALCLNIDHNAVADESLLRGLQLSPDIGNDQKRRPRIPL